MKRLLALVFAVLLILSGCMGGSDNGGDAASVSESDSTAEFDIYPDNNPFTVVGRFDRAQYKALNDLQKSIYIKLDNALYNMQEGFVPLGECEQRDVELAYYALRNDRPEYFWIPNEYSLRSNGNGFDFRFVEKDSDWVCSEKQRAELEREIKAELAEFLKTVGDEDTEYQLELAAHDRICDRVTYDNAALISPENNAHAWSIVGGIVGGKAVCEGYSRAFQVMMYMMGIDCSLVTGVMSQSHMWNTVKIDGDWYHVDTTSDDTESGFYHFFFNVTDEYIQKGRTVDKKATNASDSDISSGKFNLFLPSCTATKQNYHVVNSLYIGSADQVESTVVSVICDAVRSGRSFAEFAVSPKMGFVFGEGDVTKTFKIERCISAVNAELSGSQRIKSYSYGGIAGALGFTIGW